MGNKPSDIIRSARATVEHENMLHRVVIEHSGKNTYAWVDGQRRKLYPTDNTSEPWTTNISNGRIAR